MNEDDMVAAFATRIADSLREQESRCVEFPHVMKAIMAHNEPILLLSRIIKRLAGVGVQSFLEHNLPTFRRWNRDDYVQLAALVRDDELANYYVSGFLVHPGGIDYDHLVALGLAEPAPVKPRPTSWKIGNNGEWVEFDAWPRFLKMYEACGIAREEVEAFRLHLDQLFPPPA